MKTSILQQSVHQSGLKNAMIIKQLNRDINVTIYRDIRTYGLNGVTTTELERLAFNLSITTREWQKLN